ncbi:hypothetical protein HK102_012283, partial [Quaeritorhiza haematococci]
PRHAPRRPRGLFHPDRIIISFFHGFSASFARPDSTPRTTTTRSFRDEDGQPGRRRIGIPPPRRTPVLHEVGDGRGHDPGRGGGPLAVGRGRHQPQLPPDPVPGLERQELLHHQGRRERTRRGDRRHAGEPGAAQADLPEPDPAQRAGVRERLAGAGERRRRRLPRRPAADPVAGVCGGRRLDRADRGPSRRLPQYAPESEYQPERRGRNVELRPAPDPGAGRRAGRAVPRRPERRAAAPPADERRGHLQLRAGARIPRGRVLQPQRPALLL